MSLKKINQLRFFGSIVWQTIKVKVLVLGFSLCELLCWDGTTGCRALFGKVILTFVSCESYNCLLRTWACLDIKHWTSGGSHLMPPRESGDLVSPTLPRLWVIGTLFLPSWTGLATFVSNNTTEWWKPQGVWVLTNEGNPTHSPFIPS